MKKADRIFMIVAPILLALIYISAEWSIFKFNDLWIAGIAFVLVGAWNLFTFAGFREVELKLADKIYYVAVNVLILLIYITGKFTIVSYGDHYIAAIVVLMAFAWMGINLLGFRKKF